MGWGEVRETADRSIGTTGAIAVAHEALDQVGVPAGSLANRILVLIGRLDGEGVFNIKSDEGLKSEVSYRCHNPQCPWAGNCGGFCARNF